VRNHLTIRTLIATATALSLKAATRTGTPTARQGKLAVPGALVGLILAAAMVAGGVLIVADDSDGKSGAGPITVPVLRFRYPPRRCRPGAGSRSPHLPRSGGHGR
jgi:subtilisin family serine protease